MDREPTRPGQDGTGAPPVGERIRRRRDELGLTAKDLAERVGISASYLSLIERQGRVPSPEVAAALAHELGDDVDLYMAWASSKDVADLGTYARRIDRLVQWTTDPERRRRIASGEELDDDDVLDEAAEIASGLTSEIDAALAARPSGGLGSLRDRIKRYGRALGVADRVEESLGHSSVDQDREFAAPAMLRHELAAPESPMGEPARVRVPLYPNVADPAEDPEPLEVLELDSRLLPPGATDCFAYRPDVRAGRRIRDLVRPGDLVILTPRPGPFGQHSIHAVRHGGRVVLTRVAVKSGMLAMLPAPGDPSSIEWISLDADGTGGTRDALERIVAGSVVATLRWWGDHRPPFDHDRRRRVR